MLPIQNNTTTTPATAPRTIVEQQQRQQHLMQASSFLEEATNRNPQQHQQQQQLLVQQLPINAVMLSDLQANMLALLGLSGSSHLDILSSLQQLNQNNNTRGAHSVLRRTAATYNNGSTSTSQHHQHQQQQQQQQQPFGGQHGNLQQRQHFAAAAYTRQQQQQAAATTRTQQDLVARRRAIIDDVLRKAGIGTNSNMIGSTREQQQQQQQQQQQYTLTAAPSSYTASTAPAVVSDSSSSSGSDSGESASSTHSASIQQRNYQGSRGSATSIAAAQGVCVDTNKKALETLGSTALERRINKIPYFDASTLQDPDATTVAMRKSRGGVSEPFPDKLYRMLIDASASEGHASIISFHPHGRSFGIHQPDRFVKDVLPKYFRQSRLSSFHRQLNLYGFARINTGCDAGGYYHELFLRGRPALGAHIHRVGIPKSVPRKRGVKAYDPSVEPDFYRLPPVRVSALSSPAKTQSIINLGVPPPAMQKGGGKGSGD